MMFLLIEDDEIKRSRVDDFLREKYTELLVDYAFSLQSGLRKALTSYPDLVLLDMNLPNYDITPEESGGRILQFGGREFLRQIRRRGLTLPVIVVTHFDYFGEGKYRTTLADLDAELRADYAENYFGSISYRATSDDWKNALVDLIREATGLSAQ